MPVDEKDRADFETAMGEAVCPPVPFELASAHECCEVIRDVVGPDVTPARLSALPQAGCEELAAGFGRYFECAPPSPSQIEQAIARTLARWPA